MVITEADGAAPEASRIAGELHAALADEAVAVHAPEEAAEVAELWRWRSSVAFAILAQRGGAFSEDIAVPLDRLRDVARETLALGERHGIPSLSFGHAGDGNIHSTFLFSPDDPDQAKRADAACHDLFELALALGGTVTGEHGIGWLKRGKLPQQLGPVGYDLHTRDQASLRPEGPAEPRQEAVTHRELPVPGTGVRTANCRCQAPGFELPTAGARHRGSNCKLRVPGTAVRAP